MPPAWTSLLSRNLVFSPTQASLRRGLFIWRALVARSPKHRNVNQLRRELLMIAWPAKAAARIRPIGVERSAECATIHAASFAHPWQEADFEQLFVASGTFADGAIGDRDERLAGFVLSRIAADEAEILTIAVAPEWRARGIATQLLAPHLSGLAANRVNRLFLEVEAENTAALALYANFGFKQVGERKAYYRTADASFKGALLMRRDLL
jgi:ribosomal-protein-alanine N-acetyltransferase